MTSPSGQNLALQAGGSTYAEVDTDGFVRLATPLPRTADDDRAARADFVKGVGQRFNNYVEVASAVTLAAADAGSMFLYTGSAVVNITLPPVAEVEDFAIYTVESYSAAFNLVSSDNPFVARGGAPTTIPVGFGQTIQVMKRAEGYWAVPTDPRAIGGRLQLLGVVTNPGVSVLSQTWPAGAYQQVELQFSGASILPALGFRDAAGNWTDQTPYTLSSQNAAAWRGSLKLYDAALDRGVGFLAATSDVASPSTGRSNNGTVNGDPSALPFHAGGCTGLRASYSANLPGTYAFFGG